MRRIGISVELPSEEVQFLGELADLKHCTLGDMIEEAVALFAEQQRERFSRRANGD
jgi:hypothetical protein